MTLFPGLDPAARRAVWRWGRLVGGGLVLAVLVRRLGAEPFLDGVRRVDATSVAAALAITAMTTVVSAWRWRLIARGLGLQLTLRSAVGSYYRSQFLNSVLPGGFLGDVDRGVRHGAQACDLSRGLRSVLWDRVAGQAVQIGLATATLLLLGSPARPAMSVIAGGSAVLLVVVSIVALAVPTRGPSWSARLAHTVRHDLRAGLLTVRNGPAIVAASVLVVAGHVGVFFVAAAAQGSPLSVPGLLPLGMLLLLSMTVPINIGGWGPREGVAAWAFAAAGLGAERGVEIATTYGVLSLLATLPGAVVLVLSRRNRRAGLGQPASRPGLAAQLEVLSVARPTLAPVGGTAERGRTP